MAKKHRKAKRKLPEKMKSIKLSEQQLQRLLKAVQGSNLSPENAELFKIVVYGNRTLVELIEAADMTITKLRRIIFDASTETMRNRKARGKDKNDSHASTQEGQGKQDHTKDKATSEEKTKPPKGHGRLPVSAYEGADIIDVEWEDLKPGDACPDDFCDGRLYEMREPGVLLRITGGPSIRATHYQLQKLRCNLCEVIYTAPAPEGIGDQKYDEACVAMLMIHRYFMSIPLYRQENLQRYLGVPIPSSTQWELMAAYADTLTALYDAFLYDAAQAKGISLDDTKARVLEQMAHNKQALSKKDRRACYTSGFVSTHDDHISYIFLTNNQPGGKDLPMILSQRDPDLGLPYLMCDALTANIPSDISDDLYILCYCLVHARRQFYDLPDGYDDLSDTVLRLIGKIYDVEADTQDDSEGQRLAHHQKHSAPVMRQLKTYLIEQQKVFEPNSVAGKAIRYMLKRWTELSQFLRHKGVPIDNNITERALKLVIQARKSSMFYKTLKSARIASMIQTALYSAAQNDINPYDYMCAILRHTEHVKAHPERWLPWRYQSTLGKLADGKARQAEGNDTG